MKPSVFICWSGDTSQRIALALRKWLRIVFTQIEPFMSLKDTEKGLGWHDEISSRLEGANVGIVCLTPDNLDAPWLYFEAGALAKKIKERRVCTFLWQVESKNVPEPLDAFQHTTTDKDDIRQMLDTINRSLGASSIDHERLNRLFQLTWRQFAQDLNRLQSAACPIPPRGSDSKMLHEIYTIVRGIEAKLPLIVTDFDRRIAEIHNAKQSGAGSQDDGGPPEPSGPPNPKRRPKRRRSAAAGSGK